MLTLSDVIDRHGFDVLEQLDRQVAIPFIDGIQHQGDTSIIPLDEIRHRITVTGTAAPVPAAGIVVVEPIGAGHEHRLFAHQGTCLWNPGVRDTEQLAIGVLVVPDGALALQAHKEHGYSGIAPGEYVIGRQREQAGEERLVAD